MSRREDCHVLRELDFEADGQRTKGRQKRTSKKQAEEKNVRLV